MTGRRRHVLLPYPLPLLHTIVYSTQTIAASSNIENMSESVSECPLWRRETTESSSEESVNIRTVNSQQIADIFELPVLFSSWRVLPIWRIKPNFIYFSRHDEMAPELLYPWESWKSCRPGEWECPCSCWWNCPDVWRIPDWCCLINGRRSRGETRLVATDPTHF